jgi:hypothetical protein
LDRRSIVILPRIIRYDTDPVKEINVYK